MLLNVNSQLSMRRTSLNNSSSGFGCCKVHAEGFAFVPLVAELECEGEARSELFGLFTKRSLARCLLQAADKFGARKILKFH
jgi:hypothetical protein